MRLRSLILLPFIKLLLLLIVGYVLWVLIAYRDIPVGELEQRYGGDNLQRVMVDGVNLRYKVEGKGPVLVLLHSHYYTMRQWQPWVDELSDRFTLVRFDLTSHGLTGPDPSGDYSRERGTALLKGLLDHLNIHQASIVGSSTGAGIAYTFAAKYPERTQSLVLINAPGMPKTSNKYMDKTLPSWGSFIFYLLPQRLFNAFLKAPIIDDSLVTPESVTEFFDMYRREGNRSAEYARMRAYEKGDVSSLLAKITAPVLVMWGAKNPQLPLEHVEQFKQKLNKSKAVESIVYPDVGHVIPLEIPYQSAKDVAAFVNAKLEPQHQES
ncbi:alpha/beta fold hydrolase [Shewanella acanthi]|uniref:alpha/beta fold hydrolase n=1 Tax=Shewanella acanthi TaxID=2864212 RepID=UPI001C65DF6C|nr:alpha/beta hydrolase [Shewanella acanthi]QYJ78809.1 alpha/beta hydrolase [Shewanella acanthi]